jgi:hypothetical protein
VTYFHHLHVLNAFKPSVYVPTGPGRKRKDRKDVPVGSSCFLRIGFSRPDDQEKNTRSVDLMKRNESQDIDNGSISESCFDKSISTAPLQITENMEQRDLEDSMQIDSNGVKVIENDRDGENDTEKDESSQAKSASKKRKKFEKSRASSRLKDVDAAIADSSAGQSLGTITNGSNGISAVSFEDLSSINDYLPSALLPELRISFAASSIEFHDEKKGSHAELELNSSRVGCMDLLARLEKTLLSPAAKQSAFGTTSLPGQNGKKKSSATNSSLIDAEKGGLVDWLSSPPIISAVSSAQISPNDDAVSSLYQKDSEVLDDFKRHLFEGTFMTDKRDHRIHCADFVYLIVEYLISRLVGCIPLDTYLIRVLVLSIQCLHKFAGIDVCKIVEDRITAAVQDMGANKEFLKEYLLQLMILCEVFIDCLTDRNGSKALDVDEEIAISDAGNINNSTANPLLSSTKARLFSSFFAALCRVADRIGLEIFGREMLVRWFWVSVRASEVEGDAIGAVAALKSCLQAMEEMEQSREDSDPNFCIRIPHW